jgi:hypothetical protein
MILPVAIFMCGTMARGETFLATTITNDVASSFSTTNGMLTITSFANSNATATADLGQAGNWFGVVNGNPSAIDGAECLTLRFATNAALFRLGHIWTRSRIIISGFASDPGFSDANGYVSGVTYTNGTLSYFHPWDGGVEHDFTFRNPEASTGRTLRMNVFDSASGWQATITRIDYSVDNITTGMIDLGSSRQTMDNFAASGAWSMQNVGLWADSNRTAVADLLFTTNNGIGLSAWRFNLTAGFDPTVQAGTLWQRWRTGSGFLIASNQYDWTQQPGQRWFLSAAKARGLDQFIAMVYSPPTNFTRNGHVYGTDGLGSSNLKPGYEPAFAQFVADVLAHFKTNSEAAERVAFDYVMPINEPFWEWNGSSQEGSRHANSDIIAQTTALRSALDARGLATEIVLAEAGTLQSLYTPQADISSKYGKAYGNYLSAFDSITNILSSHLSAHSYFTDDANIQLVSIRQTVSAQFATHPRWNYWQSEYCILGADGPGRDLSMTTALNMSRVIWADVTIANARAWHWWLALSQADYKDGLLYTDFWQPGDEESLYCSKNFWAFGQWSRFIRPGWKRVDLPGYDDLFGLMGAAFVDPGDNTVAMVFVNHSGASRRIAPRVLNLPAGKAVAFWSSWLTSTAPSDNLSPLPPIGPNDDCFIPPNAVLTLAGSLVSTNAAASSVITNIPDQTARAGDTLRVSLDFAQPAGPANLTRITAYSDNAALLSPSAMTVSENVVTNGITTELFVNFSGANLDYLAAAPRFPNAPNASYNAIRFETPQNQGSKHGTRMRGFVVPPQTGNYTFWIASRDGSELYLSTDENPATKTRIAGVENFTGPREWTNEVNQQSAPIPLVAGKRYYIEAVHVATGGADNLAVGWQLPDQTLERPIPGSRLSPWSNPFAPSARRNLTLPFTNGITGTANIFIVATDSIGKTATNHFAVTVNPTKPPPNLTAQLSNGNLLLHWPADYIGWRLEEQTNGQAPGFKTNWTILTNSMQNNVWTSLVSPENPFVFYRLSLPR